MCLHGAYHLPRLRHPALHNCDDLPHTKIFGEYISHTYCLHACAYVVHMTLYTVVENDFLCPTSSRFSCIASSQFPCTHTCNGSDDNDCRVDDHCCAGWGHLCWTSTQKMKVCRCASSTSPFSSYLLLY